MASKKTRISMVERLSHQLDRLEQDWIGQTIGIGYEADTDTGQITITLEALNAPALTLTITADVTDIHVGAGDEN